MSIPLHSPPADSRIQRVENLIHPTLPHLPRMHLPQDRAHCRGRMRNRPGHLALNNGRIARVVKFQRQGGIGRRADNVFGLLDIAQGMSVGAYNS